MSDHTKSKFDQRHQRLLAAGRDMVEKEGISALSMDALASAVGISRPTAYHHFKNADDAFEKIAYYSLGHVDHILGCAQNCQGTTKQRIIALLMSHEVMGRFHPDDYNIVEYLSYPWIQKIVSPPLLETYRERAEGYLQLLTGVVGDAVTCGDLETVPLDLSTSQFASNMLSIAVGLSTSIVKQRIAHCASKPIDEWGEARKMLIGILDGYGWGEHVGPERTRPFFDHILETTYPSYWLELEAIRLGKKESAH